MNIHINKIICNYRGINYCKIGYNGIIIISLIVHYEFYVDILGVEMARVTVEDCVEIVPNRFELVVVASERAKNITAGSSPTVERDNDKNAVVALREIAERTINVDVLREAVIQQNQRYANFEPEIIDDNSNSTELSSDLIDEVKAFSHQSDQPSQNDSGSSVDDNSFSFSEDNLDVDD